MTEYLVSDHDAAKAVQAAVKEYDRMIETVNRKRNIRPSEKAMWLVDLKRRKAALERAFQIVNAVGSS